MTTGEVLFVGGPNAGQRGYIEIREAMTIEQVELPSRDSRPDPWKYNHGKRMWVCRYTRRRSITEGDAVIYAPTSWTNPRVLSELIRGYRA
jgi:hypothetical protein